MSELYTHLALLAGIVLALGLFTRVLRDVGLSEPVMALAAGIALGPVGLQWLDLGSGEHERRMLETFARFTLAIMLINVALRLPHLFLLKRWRSVALVLVPGMLGMWGISSLVMWGVLGMPVVMALLVGAVVTPTDPVLASGVASGSLARKHLRPHVRHLLSAESGANDGLAMAFVMLPLALMTHSGEDAWRHWAVATLLREVGGGLLLGLTAGYVVGKLQNWTERRGYAEESPVLASLLALAFGLIAVADLLHVNGLFAVFVAGASLDAVRTGLEQRQSSVTEVIKQALQIPVFVYLGVVLPWGVWGRMGWPLAGAIVAVLLLRRVPVWLMLRPVTPLLKNTREALFLGWFGPIGVAALYYAAKTAREGGGVEVFEVTAMVVAGSLVAHGVTAPYFTRWMGRHERPKLIETSRF